MNEIFLSFARVAMLVFLVTSMVELGLSLTLKEVLAPLRDVRLVALLLVANFVVVPLVAFGLTRVLRLEPAFATGLMLLALAPGAPFIPKVAHLARGHLAFAAALMVMLMVGSVVYLPLTLPHVIAGAEVNAWKIEQSLFLCLLLPLFIGLLVHAKSSPLAARLRPVLVRLSNLSGAVVLVLIVALNLKSVASLFGTWAIIAALLFAVLSAATGWLLGGADRASCITLGIGTALRNVAAALVVGAQNFKEPKVSVMVVVTALVALIVLLPLAHFTGQRMGAATPMEHPIERA